MYSNGQKSHRGYQRLEHERFFDPSMPEENPSSMLPLRSVSVKNYRWGMIDSDNLGKMRSASVKNRTWDVVDTPDLKSMRSVTLKSPAKEKVDTGTSKPKQLSKAAKTHPIFSFFGQKKSTKTKPEVLRYLEYLKEGGTWDPNSNRAVIHYK